MYSWEDQLINLSNEEDHETQYELPKQIDSLVLKSPGRYHILLSRTNEALTKPNVDSLIVEEYGLDELQEQMPQEHVLPPFQSPSDDLVFIFVQSNITLTGDVSAFKAGKGIGNILGFRTIVNDGNTQIYHFWDNHFQYVLLHQVKY